MSAIIYKTIIPSKLGVSEIDICGITWDIAFQNRLQDPGEYQRIGRLLEAIAEKRKKPEKKMRRVLTAFLGSGRLRTSPLTG